jgi:hypothetical protein
LESKRLVEQWLVLSLPMWQPWPPLKSSKRWPGADSVLADFVGLENSCLMKHLLSYVQSLRARGLLWSNWLLMCWTYLKTCFVHGREIWSKSVTAVVSWLRRHEQRALATWNQEETWASRCQVLQNLKEFWKTSERLDKVFRATRNRLKNSNPSEGSTLFASGQLCAPEPLQHPVATPRCNRCLWQLLCNRNVQRAHLTFRTKLNYTNSLHESTKWFPSDAWSIAFQHCNAQKTSW